MKRRHYADHGVRSAREANRLADDAGSPPNRRCTGHGTHTTTSGLPGLSSAAVKIRPSIGAIGLCSSRPEVVSYPNTRSEAIRGRRD